jgi:phosphate transport system substrate-binding protein
VQNRDGQFVQPDDLTFQAAAAGADWKGTPGFGAILTDQPGKSSWPISGASFILLQAKQDKPQNGLETMEFFEWAFKNGGAMASALDYVPSRSRWSQIADAWKTQVRTPPASHLER